MGTGYVDLVFLILVFARAEFIALFMSLGSVVETLAFTRAMAGDAKGATYLAALDTIRMVRVTFSNWKLRRKK